MKGLRKRADSNLSFEQYTHSIKGFSKRIKRDCDEEPLTLLSNSYIKPFSEFLDAPVTKVIVDPLIKVRALFAFDLNFHSKFIMQ